MSVYKTTIPGLESVANEENKSLFDFLTVPEGMEKDDLVDNIIIQCGSYEALYSDIDFLRYAIGAWARKNQRTWTKWQEALDLEYNPLENYDRQESWDDGHQGNKSDSSSETTTTSSTESGTDSNTHTYNNVKDKHELHDLANEQKRAAFNSPNYENAEKEIGTGYEDTTRSGNETDSGANSLTSSGSGSKGVTSSGNDSYLNRHTGRVHGNIGVTTSQQMLQSELDIARFNIYNQITDMFIVEFTLPVFD